MDNSEKSSVTPLKKVLFAGTSNFPHGLAEVQRLILISKSLIVAGYEVEVLSYKFTLSSELFNTTIRESTYQGIKYRYTVNSFLSGKSFLMKTLLKIRGKLLELRYIYNVGRTKKNVILFISTKDFFHTLFYFLITRFAGIKCISNYVEYYGAINQNKGFRNSLNNWLFDRISFRLSDGIIPISSFLVQYLESKRYNKPILKIPIICDLTRFTKKSFGDSKDYFCYCGSVNYMEVVFFVVDSFKRIKDKCGYKLYLIISGAENEKVVRDLVARKRFDLEDIVFLSNVTNTELENLFSGAKALLIPLRDTIQDIARFPHKIGEYTATGVPVISTKIGEVNTFFTDGKNALLTNHYDVDEFAMKMQLIVNNPELGAYIGKNGRKICEEVFDYSKYAEPLDKFINTIGYD